jgi:hypothetical protein
MLLFRRRMSPTGSIHEKQPNLASLLLDGGGEGVVV